MAEQLPLRLILGSGSAPRRELLDRAGQRFEVSPPGIDEPSGVGVKDIRAFVQRVAWMKAAAVAPRFAEGVILAADSVGWVDGQVLGKPADAMDARHMLKLLGGREHELWTGVVLWRRPDDVQLAWQECSRVFLRALSDAELDVYLTTRPWRENSGAYAIQEPVDPYLRVVAGSVSNVIGLPMESLTKLLPWFARGPMLP